MARFSRVGLTVVVVGAVLCSGALVGCGDDAPTYENACPAIVHAGSASWQDGSLRFGVWIRDVEEDPVDLIVTTDKGDEVVEVYGHGAVGLASAADEKGAPHEIVLSEKSLVGMKELTLEPVDAPGCTGDAVTMEVPPQE